MDRYFLTVLLAIGLLILIKRRIHWPQAIKNNSWLFVLFLFMLVSILWSDFPFVSLKRWVRTVGSAVMALVVLSEADSYEAIYAVLRRTMYLVIPLSMLFVKYFPLIGVAFGRWSGVPYYIGVTLNKNSLGEICAIWMFFFLWTLALRREEAEIAQPVRGQIKCEWVLVFFTLYLMKGPSGYGASGVSYSATSIAVLIIGLGVFWVMRRFKNRLPLLGQWAAMALVGYVMLATTLHLMGTSLMSVVAPVLGRDASLTGRTDLFWDVLVQVAWRHPWLGLGYGEFWIKPVPGLTLDSNEAHNGYLDVFLELGVVGLILLALVVWMYFRKTKKELHENFNWGALRMSYLVMFLFHNWTETTLLRSTEFLWNLFILFAVVHPKEWTGRVAEPIITDEEEPVPAEAASPKEAVSV